MEDLFYIVHIFKPLCVCLNTGGSECSWDKERLTSPPAGAHSGGPGGGAGAPGGAAAGAGGGGAAGGAGSGRGPAITAVNQQQLQQQQQQLLANSEYRHLLTASIETVLQVNLRHVRLHFPG